MKKNHVLQEAREQIEAATEQKKALKETITRGLAEARENLSFHESQENRILSEGTDEELTTLLTKKNALKAKIDFLEQQGKNIKMPDADENAKTLFKTCLVADKNSEEAAKKELRPLFEKINEIMTQRRNERQEIWNIRQRCLEIYTPNSTATNPFELPYSTDTLAMYQLIENKEAYKNILFGVDFLQ